MRVLCPIVLCLLVVSACGGKKLDRAEVDRVVKTADSCTKDDDLMCVVQAEKHLGDLAAQAGDLGKEDKDYLATAAQRIEADIETMKNARPGQSR